MLQVGAGFLLLSINKMTSNLFRGWLPTVRVLLPHGLPAIDHIAGSVKPIVDTIFEFGDVPKAYERIMTTHARGKVVVRVDPAVN